MTELQGTINNLKEVINSADLMVQKMEKAQEDLEKPKQPKFPPRFFGAKDSVFHNRFLIGLEAGKLLQKWGDLPLDFVGRGGFSKRDIQRIIKGLKILIGESTRKGRK